MTIHELDTIVLDRDLPETGLRKGDVGAVVHVYGPDHFDVEFVRASGRTQAVVELSRADVRSLEDSDVPAVRPLSSRRGAA